MKPLYRTERDGNRSPLSHGECHRYPPKHDDNIMRIFPKVLLYDDYCGEYSVIDEQRAKHEEIKDTTEIMYLELSARAENLLRRHKIINVGMTKKLTRELMKTWKHCGEKTIDEIINAVRLFYDE